MLPKVFVGVITGDFIRSKTVQTLLALYKSSPHVAQLVIQHGPYIHINRDRLVEQALKGDYTHLFFVDNDVCFSPEVLDRLISRDKDIIAAPYNHKTLPPMSMIRIKDVNGNFVAGKIEDLPKEPFKVFALGTGCMLIKMEVFKKLDRPWFYYEPLTDKDEGMGEDIYFCDNANKHGIEVWCDPTMQIGHIGEYIY
jgi:GT2 family glycosyltransferase